MPFIFRGYSEEELGKIVEEYEDNKEGSYKEKLMTREEAINLFHKIMYPVEDKDGFKWATKAIAAYEALGLIKFKEKEESGIMFQSIKGNMVEIKLDEVIEQMKNIGYTVRENG